MLKNVKGLDGEENYKISDGNFTDMSNNESVDHQTLAVNGNISENSSNASVIYENNNYNHYDYQVVSVIDGDTIELRNGAIIRLTAIMRQKKDMYFLKKPKFMEILVLDKSSNSKEILTDKDKYGRILRYGYCPEYFVNLKMIRCGFANIYTYPPDVKYADKFLSKPKAARESGNRLMAKINKELIEVYLNYDAEGKDTENLNGEWVSIKNTGKEVFNMNDWI